MNAVGELLRPALEGVAALGPWGPAAFVLLYAAATVLMVPGSLLTLGAGAVFGPLRGILLVWVAATLGATAAFCIGRWVARERVERRLMGNVKLRAVDQAIKQDAWRVVFLLRLSPLFPFNALNYALSLTDVPLRHYVSASALGMLPGTALYVTLGSAAGSLAGLGGTRTRTPLEWALYGIGLAATILATVSITRAARRSLEARLGE